MTTRRENELRHREARLAGIRNSAEAHREARFWAKVDRSGGPDACWLWTGKRAYNGYGLVGFRGRQIGAHRLALILEGRDPGELHVCHRCDVRLCVNPGHLFAGTRSDNMRDMERKGRGSPLRARRGEQHGRAKLSAATVQACRFHAEHGVPAAWLARTFGVESTVMSNAIRRRTWRSVA